MIMLGLYITKEVPFKAVYLHGLILDPTGIKMSKSKFNVVDPMEIIEQYGSDALRMGIISGQTPGINQPFGTPRVVAARNFCNKLWNIARYTEDVLGDNVKFSDNPKADSLADHWILGKLQQSGTAIATDLDNYNFSEAFNKLYHFVWNDYADW
jgi:valyl-tRNA synthetase